MNNDLPSETSGAALSDAADTTVRAAAPGDASGENALPGRKRSWRRRLKGPLLLVGSFLLGALIVIGSINLMMLHRYDWGAPPVFQPEQAAPLRVAIVPGAAVYDDGRPSQILTERLYTALRLYQLGKVQKILVSGNNQEVHNRESEIMRLWLIRKGVKQFDVQCDHAGFRTLDTCARAARIWNLGGEKIYIVTQRFHLPRTLFLAQAWGLQAVGVSANNEGWNTRPVDHARELIARVKAWLDINILHTEPRYYGEPESI